jgi:polysaccharide biosynthesis/export protein
MTPKHADSYLKVYGLYLIVWAALILNVSCGSVQNAAYFSHLTDTTLQSDTPLPESLVQKNDILSITVNSLNPEASFIFNSPNVTTTSRNDAQTTGYLVNSDGTIQFPLLGNIQAAGLTKSQLKDNITNSLVNNKLLVDPIVNVRFLNFRVTVLGEVNKPTVVSVPSEKISLLEALGLAGDLTIFGKRDNVLIIREEGGQKTVKRINLNSNELFTSPYYYLKSNDIVYVEPNKAKVSSSNNTRIWLPVIFSGVSMVTLILYRLF